MHLRYHYIFLITTGTSHEHACINFLSFPFLTISFTYLYSTSSLARIIYTHLYTILFNEPPLYNRHAQHPRRQIPLWSLLRVTIAALRWGTLYFRPGGQGRIVVCLPSSFFVWKRECACVSVERVLACLHTSPVSAAGDWPSVLLAVRGRGKSRAGGGAGC